MNDTIKETLIELTQALGKVLNTLDAVLSKFIEIAQTLDREEQQAINKILVDFGISMGCSLREFQYQLQPVRDQSEEYRI